MPDTLYNLKLLEEVQSSIQNIKLYDTEDGRLLLTLDSFIQLVEGEDEEVYHFNLLKPVFGKERLVGNVLILGGGDGFLARDIFNKGVNTNITLVEIDEEVIKMFKTSKRLLKMNNNSLEKCNIIIEDALKWVPNCKEKYDSIILDFPDSNSKELEKLYSKDFLSKVVKLLKDKGVISIQTNVEITAEVEKIIGELLGNVNVIKYEMSFLGEGKIVNAKFNV